VTIAKRVNRLNKRPRIREAALADSVYREMAERFRAVNKAVSTRDGEAPAEFVPALGNWVGARGVPDGGVCLLAWAISGQSGFRCGAGFCEPFPGTHRGWVPKGSGERALRGHPDAACL